VIRSTQPLVSVVIAARNEESSIGRALGSILEQTYDHWEAVVVDDGSTDATADVVRSLRDPRITLIQAGTSVGRGAARNLAIAQASGTFIAVQDADDASCPERLERLVDRAAGADQPIAVSGQAQCTTASGGRWTLRRYPESDEAIKAELATGAMAVCHAACMIRRDVLLEVSGYDPRCLRAQDLNLFLRLMPFGGMVAVPDVLVHYEHPVFLDFRYWQASTRYAHLARGRARYGGDWRLAPDNATVSARPLEPLRYGVHLALRAGRYVQVNRILARG
jgi:glycosyltransferase involved in cell wall biosynthesis